MNQVIQQMLARYECRNENDYINAIREIMQELALQGLWRGKFFEHAAFYGGTALRILYGLNRGSEDLDFSLLHSDKKFRISDYSGTLKRELAAFGFTVDFVEKAKTLDPNIDSAFLKANTKIQLISIGMPATLTDHIHSRKELKIKLEIDIDPPPGFQTEVKVLLRPIPHMVRVYTLPDLLAGKLHAVLCRKWRNRSKGRDWYDMVWYAGNHPQIDLAHLEQRMRQSGDYPDDQPLTLERLQAFLGNAIDESGIETLKADVRPFIRDQQELVLWNKDFFRQVIREFHP
ncbi:nucleotidyl transferase AbiEii/AbiGii toxin family protein [Victivallis sp. Marseille-Q1083]|uniref:nucleotidyl transferase AbiEii/AbiGii toxin family protein n=1 Tax=Victivallis sp. Marseille-Q1083 TaxID=2717288 RepID=UPI001589199B|nr:nucleotidyl transferase AbiEii/AbiGii toxin family protein [Victivallis sp. Marseille-Q1083]